IALGAICLPAQTAAPTKDVPSVRRVQVLRSQGAVEIEIEGSDRLVPQAQVLTGPDRLVVDFPNAVPGSQLRNQAVNRGEVKNLRVSLFASKPPVTRVVLDLTGPQPYQIFPSGRTVMVKVGGAGTKTAELNSTRQPGLVNTSYPAQPLSASAPPAPAKPPLQVSFENGLLTISSDKASLSEILFAVHERTGADIAIPAGAEQEKVMADLGPGPAPEVLAHLLNGSKFNFLILSAQGDARGLDRVILSQRTEGGVSPPALAPMQTRQPVDAQDDGDVPAPPARPAESIQPATAPAPPPPARQVPSTPPDTKAPETTDVPD
ncbi:MAG: AMIN domain-containing protein, partial [Candidatus Sulfotelmatobacter sp.]